MKSSIEVQGLTLRKKNKTILNHINLKIGYKEVIGFVCDDAKCGSSIIKSMVGIINDYAGDIYINGYSIKKNREKALKTVGLISKTPLFYDYLTIEENIKIFNKFYRNISSKTVEEKLRLMGLFNRKNDKCKKLSQLSRNKLSLIYVLLSLPKVILLDDFFQDIDDETEKFMFKFIEKEKTTSDVSFIISDKDIDIMSKVCTRIVFIKDGEIININTVDYITENYPSIKEYRDEIMN